MLNVCHKRQQLLSMLILLPAPDPAVDPVESPDKKNNAKNCAKCCAKVYNRLDELNSCQSRKNDRALGKSDPIETLPSHN